MGFLGDIGNFVLGAVGAGEAEDQFDEQVEQDRRNYAFSKEQFEFQKQLAKEGLRWRVDDAKAAGIHPAVAMGMNPSSASPVSVGGGLMPNSSYDASMAQAGDALGRAMSAGKTQMERLQERLLETQIEGMEIENAQKLSAVALKSAAQSNPPFPSAGFGDENIPAQVMMSGHGYNRPIINPELSQSREDMPSEYARQLFEDMVINPWQLTKAYARQQYNRWTGR